MKLILGPFVFISKNNYKKVLISNPIEHQHWRDKQTEYRRDALLRSSKMRRV